MPFDVSDSVLSAPIALADLPNRRARIRPLNMGVFNYDGAWKVYGEFDRATAYDSRDLAISAAEARVLEAALMGRPATLFIQDEDGELRQAAVERPALNT